MNKPLARCIVEAYLNSVELLGTGMQIIERFSESSRSHDELLSACTEVVLFARSLSKEEPRHFAWRIQQVEVRFRAVEDLLRELGTRGGSRGAYVGAAIEIAERGGEAARNAGRMLASRPFRS